MCCSEFVERGFQTRGYGNLNHCNGYTTRLAQQKRINSENGQEYQVEVQDEVQKR